MHTDVMNKKQFEAPRCVPGLKSFYTRKSLHAYSYFTLVPTVLSHTREVHKVYSVDVKNPAFS